jgi:hypothetical protein
MDKQEFWIVAASRRDGSVPDLQKAMGDHILMSIEDAEAYAEKLNEEYHQHGIFGWYRYVGYSEPNEISR